MSSLETSVCILLLTFVEAMISHLYSLGQPVSLLVQAHTNLTEIKQSLGLFARAGVPFNRIVLGLGFYVRTLLPTSRPQIQTADVVILSGSFI